MTELRPGRALNWLTDAEWVDRIMATLPTAWQDTLRREWRGKWSSAEPMRQRANLAVLHAVRELGDSQRAGLRPDANDETIRQRARVFARHYAQGIAGAMRQWAEWPRLRALEWALDNMERHGMADFWPGHAPKVAPEGALARVQCETWWRRTLRKLFARTVERCSIGLGLVNKARQCYVSDLSNARRRQQVARNAASLERTELENEYGQRMKLSELAAKSTANKAVRRAELMTRISGFDAIAVDLGHAATFITVTCPSYMHKWTDRGRGVVPNPRYDGQTTPDLAQLHLSGQWAKARAWLARRGVELYGFRVAEPHHDGCPHWHFLLFHAPGQLETVTAGFRRYFLDLVAPGEPGAQAHRVKVEQIDRSKGSAASYLAKYISKNIDGHGVSEDLFGAPMVETSRRVDAWASTWRIRQFQQLGGPPVTVWRELRRINTEELPADLLPAELAESLTAVNVRDTDPDAKWAQGWAAYVRAQGGPCVPRVRLAIRLMRQETGEVGRYGEVRTADVIGVQAAGRNWHRPAHMVAMLGARAPVVARPAAAVLESERCAWTVVGAGVSLPAGEAGRPWTRVNNCTHLTADTGQGVRDVVRFSRGKLGRFRPRAAPAPLPGGPPAIN
ncbi:replication endonuclease [Hydrogenophaga intermedia]|uniref:replication endonuclease n=1 Tax=Hydrogenophaga intermedia TaxID=65786 RepID=UPI0020431F99|nr:replication endonuclease [Hydrogenophaga intermedia]MCM3565936.1 replication endonuclease [Hydrogenophaga intermedia]